MLMSSIEAELATLEPEEKRKRTLVSPASGDRSSSTGAQPPAKEIGAVQPVVQLTPSIE